MGTVETQSKAPSGRSSPSPENDKNELREALCALKGGPPENGVGFSSHGNQGLGDGDDGVVEVVKSRVFETKVSVQKDFMGREGEDGCQGLADSEMNGVSSLLKMRGSGRRLMFSYGGESGGSEKLKSGGGGSFGVGMEGGRKSWKRSEDEDDQYGKIVTIDVPIAEASENKDLEVEDLGDEGHGFSVGDFVWGKIKSHPWWPGRIYDPYDASDFALKLRQKNRLLVAYFGDGTFAWCHPSQLKLFGENFQDMVRQSSSRAFVNAVQEAVNEVGRLLDLTMGYSWASKKTRSELALPLAKNSGIKEGVRVPENGIERFSDVLIEPAELLSRVKQIAQIIAIASTLELEILKARLSAFYLSRGGYKLPNYEVPQPVPGLEDNSMDETVDVGRGEGAVEAPVQGPSEEDYPTLLVSPKSGELSYSHEISGNRSNHRIKQKSIAEILGEDKVVSTTKSKEGDTTEKMMVKKKRKGCEDAMASKSLQKRKGLLPSTDRIVASAKNNGIVGKVKSDKGTQMKKKKEASGNENASSGSKTETDEEGNPKEHDKGSLSRERKKSKYLSPPFTTPVRGQRKGDVETESLKVSSETQLSEPMARAANQFLKSPEPLECNGEAIQENFSKGVTTAPDYPDSSHYQTPEDDDKKVIDLAKVQAPPEEVLSKVRYAAINPQIPGNINSLENFVDFISVFRSSLYRQGSDYNVYKKHKPGRKRKKPESEIGMLRKDQKQTDRTSHNNDSEPRKRRGKETTSVMPEEKQSAEAKAGKGSGEKVSAVALLVSFGPGSSLPAKSDLITVYSKFGALNESETAVFSNTYCAQVSFLKATDAEKALNHSLNISPFGSSKVSFRLQYLSDGSMCADNSETSKSKASSAKKKNKTPAKPSASLSPGGEASKLNYIKQKLEDLTTMLEATDGKSPAVKTKLKSGMKGLLEDVNKMVESSST